MLTSPLSPKGRLVSAPTLIDEYDNMIDSQLSPTAVSNSVHAVDQNIARLKATARSIGLDLGDSESLEAFRLAHALITSFTLNYVHGTCGSDADCTRVVHLHVAEATASLGAHIREMLRMRA